MYRHNSYHGTLHPIRNTVPSLITCSGGEPSTFAAGRAMARPAAQLPPCRIFGKRQLVSNRAQKRCRTRAAKRSSNATVRGAPFDDQGGTHFMPALSVNLIGARQGAPVSMKRAAIAIFGEAGQAVDFP